MALTDRGLSKRRQGGFLRWVGVLLLLAILGGVLWTWLTLIWSYAEGERAGVLQKFVRRGWVCKTREGEIALYYGGGQYMGAGTSPQLWDFSVRDPIIAEELTHAVGRRVQLHYTEHPGIPTSCLGETRYFVDKVTVTDNEPGPGALPTPPGPQMAPGASPNPATSPSPAPKPQNAPPATLPGTPPNSPGTPPAGSPGTPPNP